jgi:hypothetical protein
MSNRNYIAWVDGVFYIARPIVLVGMLAMSAGASASVASAHAGNHTAGHLGSTAHASNQAASVNSTRSNGYFAYKNGDGQPTHDTGRAIFDCDMAHYTLCAEGE